MSLCGCGCGQATFPAPATNSRKGWVKGRPMRFLPNHHKRFRLVAGEAYRVDEDTGCWVWLLGTVKGGYPSRVRRNGRRLLAHVLFYEQQHGRVPDGLELDHLCRNRACVNPDHLEAVTHTENVRRGTRWATHEPAGAR